MSYGKVQGQTFQHREQLIRGLEDGNRLGVYKEEQNSQCDCRVELEGRVIFDEHRELKRNRACKAFYAIKQYFHLFILLHQVLVGLQDLLSSFWLMGSLVVAWELLAAAGGIKFPDQGLNPGPSASGVPSLSHWTTREISPLRPFQVFCF